jgi:hypothetical protein
MEWPASGTTKDKPMTDEPLTTATADGYATGFEAGYAFHEYADDLDFLEEFHTAEQIAEFEAARDRYVAALNIVGRKSKLKLSYLTPGPLGLSSVWSGK